MLLLTGQLYKIAPSKYENKETGEISDEFSAEVLHEENGKTTVTSLKIDSSVVPEWTKHVGKHFNAEVRPWAMPGKQGMRLGLALVNKKSLPTLMRPPAPAAA